MNPAVNKLASSQLREYRPTLTVTNKSMSLFTDLKQSSTEQQSTVKLCAKDFCTGRVTSFPKSHTIFWSTNQSILIWYRSINQLSSTVCTLTSVMGDLGLTLRAAAISWSWLTSSVMDRRSSGLIFNMEPGQQRQKDRGPAEHEGKIQTKQTSKQTQLVFVSE